MNYYGIDLGTSNTLVARLTSIRGKTEIELLETERGEVTVPSIVHFQDDGEALVGSAARRELFLKPDQTFELVKVRIGVEDSMTYYLKGQEKKISPQEVIGYLLKYIKQLPIRDPIQEAVVTVPAEFDDSRRGATQQAAEISGIMLVELLAEPSAAILYHLYKTYSKTGRISDITGRGCKNYFVFDFGGGTLDLAQVKVEKKEDGTAQLTVVENLGNSHLGGNDIDFALMKVILEFLEDEYEGHTFYRAVLDEFKFYQRNRFLRFDADPKVKHFLIDFKGEVERAKIKLSQDEEVSIAFAHPDFAPILVERDTFEGEVLGEYFHSQVRKTLEDFRAQMQDSIKLDEIVMIGGTSMIPYFKNMVEEYFKNYNLGDRVVVSEDYDTAVAKGAAIQAALQAGAYVAPFGTNRCNNVVAHDIVFSHMGKEKVLIKHGTPYPIPQESTPKKKFAIQQAIEPYISIMIKELSTLFQGESQDTIREQRIIRDMKFYHPFFYHNDHVEVQATLDQHGILHFKAVHEQTGEAIEFEAEQACQLDQRELESAKQEVQRAKVSGG